MAETIECPSCGAEVEITEALTRKLQEKVKEDLNAEVREVSQRLVEREKKLKERELAAAASEKNFDERVQEVVSKKLEVLGAEARKEAEETLSTELEDLKNKLDGASAKLKRATKTELHLRKEKAELEDGQKDVELEIARGVDKERSKIKAAATSEAKEAHELQLKDRDQVIDGMKKKIAELKQKSEQGSQQLQGESMEVSLEETLSRAFPGDSIEPVPKGVSGADVVQRVRTSAGIDCGVILWESKRTKNWSHRWLPKLRDDQRAMKAELAALVSVTLPEGKPLISNIDGVWVCGTSCSVGLAHALRQGLLNVALASQTQKGKQGKMDMLYGYLTGSEFRNRVEGFLEPFKTMMEDLEKEKRAIQRLWSKREKQIERATGSISGLYGDLQGIVGGTIPEIEALALPALADGERTLKQD